MRLSLKRQGKTTKSNRRESSLPDVGNRKANETESKFELQRRPANGCRLPARIEGGDGFN
jgi:hypothetical protein